MARMLPGFGAQGGLPLPMWTDVANMASMKRGFDIVPANMLMMQFPNTPGKGSTIAELIDDDDREMNEEEHIAWKKDKRRKQNRKISTLHPEP